MFPLLYHWSWLLHQATYTHLSSTLFWQLSPRSREEREKERQKSQYLLSSLSSSLVPPATTVILSCSYHLASQILLVSRHHRKSCSLCHVTRDEDPGRELGGREGEERVREREGGKEREREMKEYWAHDHHMLTVTMLKWFGNVFVGYSLLMYSALTPLAAAWTNEWKKWNIVGSDWSITHSPRELISGVKFLFKYSLHNASRESNRRGGLALEENNWFNFRVTLKNWLTIYHRQCC